MGGLTRALHPWFESVAYSEVEPSFQTLIAARQRTGHLDTGPIYGDVRALTKSVLVRDGLTDIDAVIGGFPCTDISTSRSLRPAVARR